MEVEADEDECGSEASSGVSDCPSHRSQVAVAEGMGGGRGAVSSHSRVRVIDEGRRVVSDRRSQQSGVAVGAAKARKGNAEKMEVEAEEDGDEEEEAGSVAESVAGSSVSDTPSQQSEVAVTERVGGGGGAVSTRSRVRVADEVKEEEEEEDVGSDLSDLSASDDDGNVELGDPGAHAATETANDTELCATSTPLDTLVATGREAGMSGEQVVQTVVADNTKAKDMAAPHSEVMDLHGRNSGGGGGDAEMDLKTKEKAIQGCAPPGSGEEDTRGRKVRGVGVEEEDAEEEAEDAATDSDAEDQEK